MVRIGLGKRESAKPGKKKAPFVFMIIALEIVFAVLIFVNFYCHDLSSYYDTRTFVQTSQRKLVSYDFFLDKRLPLLPLLFKIFNRNFVAIGYMQTILYVCSWLFLAWALMKIHQSGWMKTIAVFGILFIGLIPEFQMWNNILLSESLSISLFVIFVAFLLLHHAQKKKRHVFGMIALAALFSFTRDPNSYVVLMLAVFYLVLYFVQKTREYRYLLVAACFLLFFLLTDFTSERTRNAWDDNGHPIQKRYQESLINNFHFRVLGDKDIIEIFKQYGMPAPAKVQSAQRQGNGNWYITLCRDKKFISWVLEDGKRSYAKFLFMHPRYAIHAVVKRQKNIFLLADKSRIFKYASMPKDMSHSSFAINSEFQNRFFQQVDDRKEFLQLLRIRPRIFAFVPFKFMVIGLGGLLLLSIVVAGLFRFPWIRRDNLLYGVLFILSFPHIFLCFFGDAIEIERHCIGSLVHLFVACFLLIILLLGGWTNRQTTSGSKEKRMEWHAA